MRNLIFTIFFLSPFFCFGQKEKLSHRIYKEQSECYKSTSLLKIFEYNRIKIGWMTEIENKKNCCDTIYLIEKYNSDIEFSRKTYSATMWKSSDKKGIDKKTRVKFQSYSSENGNIKLLNEELFSNYLIYLVDKWDTEQIKEEEQKGKLMYPADMIATRIILQGDCKQIESICFDEFANFKMEDKYDKIIESED